MMFQRYAFSDSVNRVVNGDDVVFSGLTQSGKPFKIITKLSDANSWANGELIQRAFPYLNSEDREILMTGFDNECWASMFGEGE
jgi:hypothetical protein